MGVLFISITVGIVIMAIFLIIYFRRNKTIAPNPGNHDVVEKRTGKNEGIYD